MPAASNSPCVLHRARTACYAEDVNFDDVRAQPNAVRVLKQALKNDRVASAYLFDGPSGVGKTRAALALASALVCNEKPRVGCGTCTACQRAQDGKHPDVRVVKPRDEGDQNIQVEFIRQEVLPFAQYAPFEARAAVMIFADADICFPSNHSESANAMLKTLEEPRPNVHFILISARPERLLQTIRSRCQRVRFQRLPNATLQQVLEEHNIVAAERDAIVGMADGRADVALTLASEGKGATLLELAARIDATIEASKPGACIELSESLAKRDDLPLVLDTLSSYYRDVAAVGLALPTSALLFGASVHTIRDRAAVLSPERAAARVDLIRRTAEAIDRNANAQITLDSMLLSLRSAT